MYHSQMLEFCEKMMVYVPPAVRVLSPAWAPRGLHRAMFMNSVSHGKVRTENVPNSHIIFNARALLKMGARAL